MDLASWIIGGSLGLLGLALAVISIRGFVRFVREGDQRQLMWGLGLAFGSAAMVVETVVYAGFVTVALLQTYVFLSAAIVGALSLGATRILRSPRLERGYSAFMAAALAVVGVASFTTPLSLSMVTQGVITGNPPVSLLVLSSLVTGPATVVLIGSAVLSLRRSWRYQTLLMVAGAFVLGAGGTLYIASFPVALYYAEFIGISLLFLGLLSMPTPSASESEARTPLPSP